MRGEKFSKRSSRCKDPEAEECLACPGGRCGCGQDRRSAGRGGGQGGEWEGEGEGERLGGSHDIRERQWAGPSRQAVWA